MADKKISQLTGASLPLAGTEVLPIVQSNQTVKVATDDLTVKNIRSNATTGLLQIAGPGVAATRVMTVPDANFTSARTDAANSFSGNQTLSTGNLIIGTAGKGIDFSANTNAAGMTSELLTWYEEGTFTCGMQASSGTITLNGAYATGKYTRIGRQVTVCGFLVVSSVSNPVGVLWITGLPFANGANDANLSSASVFVTGFDATATTALQARIASSETRIEIGLYSGGSVSAAADKVIASAQVTFYASYFVS